MPDYPRDPVVPPFINSFMRWTGSPALRMLTAGVFPTSGAWQTANTALYLPLAIPWPYTVKRLFWVNGAAAGGNWDIGVYTLGGGKIWSAGSTAGSGNAAPQYVSPAVPFVLSPGAYLLGVNHDDTTANRLVYSLITGGTARFLGCVQQAVGAVTLPASATFAANSAGTRWPLCGITNTASGY